MRSARPPCMGPPPARKGHIRPLAPRISMLPRGTVQPSQPPHYNFGVVGVRSAPGRAKVGAALRSTTKYDILLTSHAISTMSTKYVILFTANPKIYNPLRGLYGNGAAVGGAGALPSVGAPALPSSPALRRGRPPGRRRSARRSTLRPPLWASVVRPLRGRDWT